MNIYHMKQINGSPEMGYAAHVFAMMLGQNQCDARFNMLHWEDEAIVFRDTSNNIAGIITFMEEKYNKRIWIKLGYVNQDTRAKGVYRAMWDKLVLIGRERDFTSIGGSTHIDNLVMRAVAKSFGRTEISVTLEFKL